ncbi:hypothetical protein PTTG_27313 [Puccinia triticina 1-1 BBBD Race 1]|uniref:CCHC-type domain-containing protein n=1 Tax=Puccinia triticina (isolate 1-1 / race 1 (BBBD)) TaxID=630390 RepID=A0A180GL98_PUCT1|nr:hypothetical protein PTTG_27313 [Puccinia triticina 1-1 BBBD Race 1]
MPVQHSPQAAKTPGSLGNDNGRSTHNESMLDDQHVNRHRRHAHTPLQRHHPAPQPQREEEDLSLIVEQQAFSGLVKAAFDEFGEANYLQGDGSNYRIVLGVINLSMKTEFQDMATAWDVLEAIKARFAGVTKARMMRVFQQLSRVAVNISTNPARVATEMKALVDELNGMGTSFLYDDLLPLPLLIQQNIAPGTALCFEFNRRVNAEFSLNGHQPITFEKTWKTLLAAIHQVRLTEALETSRQQVLFNTVSAPPPPPCAESVISHDDNVYIMAANPTNKYRCFRCKLTGHLISYCPLANAPAPSQPPPPAINSSHQNLPPFQEFYPILAPSGFNPTYYHPRQPPSNPNMIPLPRLRDTYWPVYNPNHRPAYAPPRPSAQAADLSFEPPHPSFNNLELNGHPAGNVNP